MPTDRLKPKGLGIIKVKPSQQWEYLPDVDQIFEAMAATVNDMVRSMAEAEDAAILFGASVTHTRVECEIDGVQFKGTLYAPDTPPKGEQICLPQR